MPHIQTTTTIRDLEFDRPLCPECGSKMWLARVAPDGAGTEHREFECPVCEVSIRSPAEIERRATIRP